MYNKALKQMIIMAIYPISCTSTIMTDQVVSYKLINVLFSLHYIASGEGGAG